MATSVQASRLSDNGLVKLFRLLRLARRLLELESGHGSARTASHEPLRPGETRCRHPQIFPPPPPPLNPSRDRPRRYTDLRNGQLLRRCKAMARRPGAGRAQTPGAAFSIWSTPRCPAVSVKVNRECFANAC